MMYFRGAQLHKGRLDSPLHEVPIVRGGVARGKCPLLYWINKKISKSSNQEKQNAAQVVGGWGGGTKRGKTTAPETLTGGKNRWCRGNQRVKGASKIPIPSSHKSPCQQTKFREKVSLVRRTGRSNNQSDKLLYLFWRRN